MSCWFDNMSNERLELEKYSCEIRLKNLKPTHDNDGLDYEQGSIPYATQLGSLKMKIKVLNKELTHRAIEIILLGD